MNWEAVSAIGQVTGAIAVIATLLYLSVQIRHSVLALRNTNAWAINEGLSTLNGRIATDPELADIWLRGVKDLDSLSPIDRERFRTLCMELLNLAVYVHGVSPGAGKTAPTHFDVVRIFGGYYQEYPGFRAMVDSVEEVIPPGLIPAFRAAHSFKGPGT